MANLATPSLAMLLLAILTILLATPIHAHKQHPNTDLPNIYPHEYMAAHPENFFCRTDLPGKHTSGYGYTTCSDHTVRSVVAGVIDVKVTGSVTTTTFGTAIKPKTTLATSTGKPADDGGAEGVERVKNGEEYGKSKVDGDGDKGKDEEGDEKPPVWSFFSNWNASFASFTATSTW